MATTSRAIVPAHSTFLARRAGRTVWPVIAAIAMAGILVAGAAAFAMSGREAVSVAAAGGTGHAAPVTSTLERALEGGATRSVPAAPASASGPADLTAASGIAGLAIRVPAASSPLERAMESRGLIADANAIVLSPASGLDARVPAASSPLERAIASSASPTGMATVVATGTDGSAHRAPLR